MYCRAMITNTSRFRSFMREQVFTGLGFMGVHAQSLCHKLEDIILPLFCNDPTGFTNVMRHSIALNGAFFNTQRMVQQYVLKAYFT